MTRRHVASGFWAALLVGAVSLGAHADDDYVRGAKSLPARAFDAALPDQPIEAWLRAQLPAGDDAMWGEHITDCGEGTGGPADAERDLPLCAEITVMRGAQRAGYLALLVGTRKRGLLKEGQGLYFGYLERAGTKYDFKRLRDVLAVR